MPLTVMIHQARGVNCPRVPQSATPSGPACKAGAPILFTKAKQFWLRPSAGRAPTNAGLRMLSSNAYAGRGVMTVAQCHNKGEAEFRSPLGLVAKIPSRSFRISGVAFVWTSTDDQASSRPYISNFHNRRHRTSLRPCYCECFPEDSALPVASLYVLADFMSKPIIR